MRNCGGACEIGKNEIKTERKKERKTTNGKKYSKKKSTMKKGDTNLKS